MASRTEKLRRRQYRKEKKRRHAAGPVSEFARPGGIQLVIDPPGVKMSEVLIALIKPEWESCANEAEMQQLLTIGAAAWNVALVKGAERTALTERLALTMPVEFRQDFKFVLEPFISRKDRMFPHIQRPILSFELTRLPSGAGYVRVISGLG